jgi:diguanylate cyclase (GGDEF)-like protein
MKISYGIRIVNFLIIFVITTGILFIPTYLTVNKTKKIFIDELGINAMDISLTAASFIEENIELYEELSSADEYIEGSYNESYYKKMLKLLQKVKKETDVDYIFTEKKVSETEIAYILDGEDPDSESFSPLGTRDSMSKEELKAFNEGIATKTDLIEDKYWGYYITGFAPIFDKTNGEVIGLVGVDFSLEHAKEIINGATANIFIIFLLINILISITVYKLLYIYHKRLKIDYTTGLYNKRYFEDYLKMAVQIVQQKGEPLSLMMVDVDNFKKINDKYGHIAGDKVLKAIAGIMQMNLRDMDICSRFGGDEIVIILPGTNEVDAAVAAERIREKVFNLDLNIDDMDSIGVTLSIGIAELKNGMRGDKLTEHADKALYVSKNTGKNKVTIYNEA